MKHVKILEIITNINVGGLFLKFKRNSKRIGLSSVALLIGCVEDDDKIYSSQPDYPDYNSYSLDVRIPDTKSIYDRLPLGSVYNASYKNDDYIYVKNYQSAAMAERNSLKLQKVAEGDLKGKDPTPLAGVVFRLEYLATLDGGEQEWRRVTFERGVAVFVESDKDGVGEYITGEDGTLLFKNLPDGKYRITEVKTVDGYNKLAAAVEIDLPYELPDNVGDDFFIQIDTGRDAYKTSDGRYRDVTMRITNTTNINDLLPLTGLNNLNLWIILIGILLILAGTAIFFYVFKKKKRQNK